MKKIRVGYRYYSICSSIDSVSIKRKDGNRLGLKKIRERLSRLEKEGKVFTSPILGGNMMNGCEAGLRWTT